MVQSISDKVTPQKIFDEMAASGLSLRDAVECSNAILRNRKQSSFNPLKTISDALGVAGAAKDLSAPLIYAGLGLPPLVGYAGGGWLAKALDADGQDVSDIQQKELVSELLANAEAVRRKRRLREPVVDESQKK